MALTKNQKSEFLSELAKKFEQSDSSVFAEFNKLTVTDISRLRRELKKVGADIKVFKKTLVELALKKLGVEFSPYTFKTQMGTIFAKGDVNSIAATIHKFSKEIIKAKKSEFTVLGAYDFKEKRFVDSNEFKAIATLPTREVLLAQIAMMLTMPLKQMMMVLNERAKRVTQ